MDASTSLPHYVQEASEFMWGQDTLAAESYAAGFGRRWGSLDLPAMGRALVEGLGEDKLFAILSLGHTATPESRANLVPVLDSVVPDERWAAALCLGLHGDARALPTLIAMLTESLSVPPEDQLTHLSPRQEFWLPVVPAAIAAVGSPAAAPSLRKALVQLSELLGLADAGFSDDGSLGSPALGREGAANMDEWADSDGTDAETMLRSAELSSQSMYRDEIVYALGQLSCFGAIVGVDVADQQLSMWRVHLVIGQLHGQHSWTEIYEGRESPLWIAVRSRLEQYFGLDANEQQETIEGYVNTMSAALLMKWQREDDLREPTFD